LFINKTGKKNTAVVIDPDAITRSVPKTTWSGWLRQKSRHYTTAKYYKPKHKFLLGLYFATQFIYYPLLQQPLFFRLKWVLVAFGFRFLIQAFMLYKSMKKMGEKDLWPWFVFLICGCFYYLIFAPALWKKPKQH
jgi:fatty acid desaturase